ncbi:MAG: anti-sigma factor family protein [Ktedonobacterales bacterium]
MTKIRNTTIPAPGPRCASFAPLLPLLQPALLSEEDADRLRAHIAGCAHCAALLGAYERLDVQLRQHIGTVPAVPRMTEEIMAYIEESDHPVAIQTPPPQSPLTAPRQPRGPLPTIAIVAALLLLVVLVQSLFASHAGRSMTTASPPTASRTTATTASNYSLNLSWSKLNVTLKQAPTAAGAFDPGVIQQLCSPIAVRSSRVAWVMTGYGFGEVYVQAACKDGRMAYGWFDLAVTRGAVPGSPGTCPMWYAGNSSASPDRPRAGKPVDPRNAVTVPGWLPPDTYATESSSATEAGNKSIYGTVIWMSTSHTFFVGRYGVALLRPDGAVAVTVAGHSGWMTQQDGMVVIQVPLRSMETYSFAGDVDPTQARTLAAQALTHLDDLLPPMSPAVPDVSKFDC